MNKRSVGIVLILYAALAGIPGVLAYFQENNMNTILHVNRGNLCSDCHVTEFEHKKSLIKE